MAGDSAERKLWSLDEYIVVGDLYLRRKRSSNSRDPEVLALARLTGRSPASISRRLGNFHGTAHQGAGLKPVTGEALAVFAAMADDSAERERLAAEARLRLTAGQASGVVQLSAAAVALVAPEQTWTTETDVVLPAEIRKLVRAEAQLVARYVAWLDPEGSRLRGVLIPAEDRTLRADLYDVQRDLLIEAKANVSREHIRYAIGQLLDYRRRFTSRPSLAVLVPKLPPPDMIELLDELGIATIWEHGTVFVEHA